MIKRIMSDMFVITAMAMTMAILVTHSEARPQQYVQQAQQAEEVFFPEPSVQISAQKVIEIFPRTMRLDNITAHTQEILAKIDQVNRQHGYVKPESPKRSHFVPGYFTHNYNYKERVLKGFDVPSHREETPEPETNRPSRHEAQDIYDQLKPPRYNGEAYKSSEEDLEKIQDYQAQMSVDHVKHIVENYPMHDYQRYQGYQGYRGYQGYNGYVGYDPYYKHYVQLVPEVTPYLNPLFAYVPPEYLQNVNVPTMPTISEVYMPNLAPMPMFYNPYLSGQPLLNEKPQKPQVPQVPQEKCTSAVTEEVKRAAKILDKSKTLPRAFKDSATLLNEGYEGNLKSALNALDQTTQPTTSTKSHKVIIENKPMEIPINEENRTLIKQLVGRHKENRQTPDSRRNTKRPNIFRPHTWFNNQPMHKDKDKNNESSSVESEDDEDISVGESIALEGGLETNKGIFGNRPFGENRRKLFSKDNTGSGIFIHKLKVRKGGVAIAGPGGIATAGSGGTAIVGPNGYAFTHPDSLAIAGSGTKVIAVDPKVNLSDIVNDVNNNGTLKSLNATLATMSARMGKVVATGPVIYYNKG